MDMLMAEYGLTLDEALDIPEAVAADLLQHAYERSFIQAENLAILIQLKVAELLTGKKQKYARPGDQKKPGGQMKPMSPAELNKLQGMFG